MAELGRGVGVGGVIVDKPTREEGIDPAPNDSLQSSQRTDLPVTLPVETSRFEPAVNGLTLDSRRMDASSILLPFTFLFRSSGLWTPFYDPHPQFTLH